MSDQTASRAVSVSDEEFLSRLGEVRDVVRQFGPGDARIVAVTKGFDRSAMDLARRGGIDAFGENYAQEVQEKAEAVGDAELHFIGRIQRNKVRKVVAHVDVWQSVSRAEILREVAKRSEDPRVMIQVRPLGDPTKDGVRPEELESMLELARDLGVRVEGLMTIGVLGDPEQTRTCFDELARLADSNGLIERSMGMSGDYRDALEAGSTMLRLGSLLFGPRPAR